MNAEKKQALYQCAKCGHLWMQVLTVATSVGIERAHVECEKCGSEYMVWINYMEFVK